MAYSRQRNWRARQRAERETQAEAQTAERIGNLMGFTDDQTIPRDHAVVGWMLTAQGTVKGAGHRCIDCQPDRPLGYIPVTRNLLAAKQPCTWCGRQLEAIRVSEKNEK